MGTGCVFNRTALYGYEPPLKPKHKKPGLLSSLCGGNRKKSSKSSKKGSDKKKSNKHVDPTVPIFSLEDIEEGVEGRPIKFFYCLLCTLDWPNFQTIFDTFSINKIVISVVIPLLKRREPSLLSHFHESFKLASYDILNWVANVEIVFT